MLLIALVLVGATQLLTSQWAAGAHSPGPHAWAVEDEPVLVLHIRASAQARGTHITLADIAFLEWKGQPIAGLGDLPIAPAQADEQVVGIEQLVPALEAAGIDPARVQVHGPIRCRVRTMEVAGTAPLATSDEAALLDWAGAASKSKPVASSRSEATASVSLQGRASPSVPASSGNQKPAPVPSPRTSEPTSPRREFIGTHGTVGETLRRELAARLELPAECIHLRFAGEDMPLAQRTGVSANDIRPLSGGDLGDVAWTVSVDGREVPIMARASATLMRAVAAQPIAAGQVVRNGDVIGQQGQIERIADRGILPAQAAGQEAARRLEAGEVLREEDLTPRLLVQAGQLISVQETRTGTSFHALARALENGWHNQVVRARREGSEEIVQVLITAPQAGRIIASSVEGASVSGSGDAIPQN